MPGAGFTPERHSPAGSLFMNRCDGGLLVLALRPIASEGVILTNPGTLYGVWRKGSPSPEGRKLCRYQDPAQVLLDGSVESAPNRIQSVTNTGAKVRGDQRAVNSLLPAIMAKRDLQTWLELRARR